MKPNGQPRQAGFTLIEVVLSIGLLAFALAVIMAALGTAGRYAANDARRTLAVDLLHRSFKDLELANATNSKRSPLLGLSPLSWGPTPATVQLWFDVDGTRVASRSKAFFRCDLSATQEASGAVGHLHGRIVWPVRQSGDRPDGHAELFTSMLIP